MAVLTTDHLAWFHMHAARNTWSSSVRGTYEYIFGNCLELGRDYLEATTLDGIARSVKLTAATVSRSLKTLAEARIIKRLKNGMIIILPPEPAWLRNHIARELQRDNQANNSRAHEQTTDADRIPPLKGDSNQTKPKATMPSYDELIKAIRARKNQQ